jgi:predicted DNA-binding transcriptional regulator AlpA
MTNIIPSTGYLRVNQIVGNPKANPPIPAIIPVSKSSWWNGVKSGKFPKPYKLGERTTVWRVEDILALIDNMEAVH